MIKKVRNIKTRRKFVMLLFKRKPRKTKLQQLEEKIFYGDYSNEDWMKLAEEVKKEFVKATAKEQQEFVDSGAGNLLEQLLEYL